MMPRASRLLALLIILGALVALAYIAVLAALTRYLRHWNPLRADRGVVTIDDVPVAARERMTAVQSGFRAMKFEEIGILRQRSRPDCDLFMAYMRSAAGTEVAIIGVHHFSGGHRQIIHTSVVVWSRLMSGPPAETTGLDQFGVREDPSGHTWWVPRTLDPSILVRFHRAACATVGALKRVDFGASLAAWHEKQLAESVEHLRRAGRAEVRPDGTAWRMTWRYAVTTVPQFLWPVGRIRAALQDRRNSRIYAAAGITAAELRAARGRFKAVESVPGGADPHPKSER